ncbi:hypothetical protein CUJ83_14495 [Methanocella sp. CWC-04]|uniref:Uncharacterized protein n=1 Tax=Methanooceanicella nereidis TaxID=2052831 RepID=A0AAP2REF7_9EURY|nr:hypothetical protein [Methanocella sp. CWC-04]MCD1296209.1 hypothetical protein [Methanocella sp. CWC-04]
MDLTTIDKKTVKTAYVATAAILMVGALVSAFYDHDYIALGFIVAASAVILAGSLFMAYRRKVDKVRDVD